MFYQVTATILFKSEDESKDFYYDCTLALAKSDILRPGEPNAEYSYIVRLLSNHDLNPPQESIILEHADNEE